MNERDCGYRELLNKIQSLEMELEDANTLMLDLRVAALAIVDATDSEEDLYDDCDCEECN